VNNYSLITFSVVDVPSENSTCNKYPPFGREEISTLSDVDFNTDFPEKSNTVEDFIFLSVLMLISPFVGLGYMFVALAFVASLVPRDPVVILTSSTMNMYLSAEIHWIPILTVWPAYASNAKLTLCQVSGVAVSGLAPEIIVKFAAAVGVPLPT